MADLFDMSVAGYGFHITGHLLALIALIIACLAITGHISYSRDKDANFEHVTLDGITYGDEGGGGTGRLRMKYISGYFVPRAAGNYFVTKSLTNSQTDAADRLIIPANSFIKEARMTVVVGTVGAQTNTQLGYQVATNNTAQANVQIFAQANAFIGANPTAAGAEIVVHDYDTNGNNARVGETGTAVNPGGNGVIGANDQVVTASTGGPLTAGLIRVDIWYHQREFTAATAF